MRRSYFFRWTVQKLPQDFYETYQQDIGKAVLQRYIKGNAKLFVSSLAVWNNGCTVSSFCNDNVRKTRDVLDWNNQENLAGHCSSITCYNLGFRDLWMALDVKISEENP